MRFRKFSKRVIQFGVVGRNKWKESSTGVASRYLSCADDQILPAVEDSSATPCSL
jgi:hypothetical protein